MHSPIINTQEEPVSSPVAVSDMADRHFRIARDTIVHKQFLPLFFAFATSSGKVLRYVPPDVKDGSHIGKFINNAMQMRNDITAFFHIGTGRSISMEDSHVQSELLSSYASSGKLPEGAHEMAHLLISSGICVIGSDIYRYIRPAKIIKDEKGIIQLDDALGFGLWLQTNDSSSFVTSYLCPIESVPPHIDHSALKRFQNIMEGKTPEQYTDSAPTGETDTIHTAKHWH